MYYSECKWRVKCEVTNHLMHVILAATYTLHDEFWERNYSVLRFCSYVNVCMMVVYESGPAGIFAEIYLQL